MSRTALSRTLAIATLAMPVLVPALTGCQTGPPAGPHTAILDQWNARIGATGLVSVTPPDEDVRVGDIYAFAISPDMLEGGSATARVAVARRIAASSRWAALPVLTDLGNEYAQRPSWPKTPDAFVVPQGGAQRQWEEPDSDGPSIFSPEQVATRLRIVGLNSFAAVSFVGNDLETIIPTEAATLISGSADPRNIAVTLRAGSAESYGLSLDTLIGLLLDDATGDGATGHVLKPPYRRNLELVADPTSRKVYLQVISEVVYIRSADITIRTIDATPSQEQVTAEELVKVAEQMQAPSSTDQPAATPAQAPAEAAADPAPTQPDEPGSAERALATKATTKLDPLYGAFVRAQAINDVLAESVGDDVPGGLVHFISVTDESVALRRLWPRGLAIGVRGLTLEVDAGTGRVLRSGPMGQKLPHHTFSAPASPGPGA